MSLLCQDLCGAVTLGLPWPVGRPYNTFHMNIIELLQNQLSHCLRELKIEGINPEVVKIADEKFGDLTTNVAMIAFSQSKELSDKSQVKFGSPRQLAEAIVKQISNSKSQITNTKDDSQSKSILDFFKNITKTEVAGPGFINFTLSEHFLLDQLDLEERLSSTNNLQSAKPEEKKRVMVEFTDPNPFKEFHLGHLYSNIVGESLARLMEAGGAVVRRVCYQGDVGMHVAKSIYGLILKLEVQNSKSDAKSNFQKTKSKLETLESKSLKDRVKLLGEAYALGSKAYTDDPEAQDEIKSLNAHVFAAAQARMVEEEGWQAQVDYAQIAKIDTDKLEMVDLLYRYGRRWSLEAFEQIYQRLGTKFEAYYFESEMSEYGLKLIKQHMDQVFVESKGAVIFPGSQHGVHDRVFVNSLGLPTYEAKELGLAPKKYQDWPYDLSIIVTGNEINDYFKVLLAAMGLVYPEIGQKTKHFGHGMLRLPEGKMSSRTGNVLTGESIINEAVARVKVILDESESLPATDRSEVAEKIGLAAVKFALLRGNIGSDVIFDFDQSISFSGNSGPYVQYTFARCMSLLRKSQVSYKLQATSHTLQATSHKPHATSDELQATLRPLRQAHSKQAQDMASYKLSEGGVLESALETLSQVDWLGMGVVMNDEERSVLRWLWQFESVVERSASEFAPHHVATYVYELASRFNSFYNKHSILEPQATGHPSAASTSSQQASSGQAKLQDFDFETTVLFRLGITAAVADRLKRGLALLGIEAPDKM